MKVFCYFVEPASYTLDLVKNIHVKHNIDYCFINEKSAAETTDSINTVYLSQLSFLAKFWFILNIWKSYNLVIVNGYNNYPFILTFLFNLYSGNKKYIAIESDTQLKIPSNSIKRWIKTAYLNFIFSNKYILGFSGGSVTHKELFRYFGMKEERIFLMPMVVDNKKYYPIDKIKNNTFTFLFVGRLISTKNVDALASCFCKNFSNKDAKLIIIGDGVLLENLRQEYKHEQIEFLGSVFGSELIEIYHNSSAFIFPSTVEAWGLVINEALSASLPVIARKEVGAVYDLIIDQDIGFVVDNWEEMSIRMLELYDDKELCNRFSENAIHLMKNKWNYDLYESCFTNAITKIKSWESNH